MKLMLLGAPGAGKGTQAEMISEIKKIPTVSTGSIIRNEVKTGTNLGKTAKDYMDKGALVPDDIVIGIVKNRLSMDDCKNGFILDGFPRTLNQGIALDSFGVSFDLVISIEVQDDEIIKRMCGRRVCPKCGATYHTEYLPSKDNMHCDKCGVDLEIRKDDKPETVKNRLSIYHNETEPLKDFYKAKGILREIIGQEKVEDTKSEVLKVLEA